VVCCWVCQLGDAAAMMALAVAALDSGRWPSPSDRLGRDTGLIAFQVVRFIEPTRSIVGVLLGCTSCATR